MAKSEKLIINAGAALQLVNASSGVPIDEADVCIKFTGGTAQYTYTQSGAGSAARYVQTGNGRYLCANLPAGSYQAQVNCKGYAPFNVPVEVVTVPLAGTIAHAIAVCNLVPGHKPPSYNDIGGTLANLDQEHERGAAEMPYPARRNERA